MSVQIIFIHPLKAYKGFYNIAHSATDVVTVETNTIEQMIDDIHNNLHRIQSDREQIATITTKDDNGLIVTEIL